MKMVCSNCDLGLKRSECTDMEYEECEFRRWTIQLIKSSTLTGFMHVLDDVLETVYENEEDLKNNKARIAKYFIEGVIK